MRQCRVICVCLTSLLLFSPISSASVSPRVLFATNFGGTNTDQITAVATDSAGNIYVAGFSTSPSLPGNNCSLNGSFDAFVARFSPAGQLLYCQRVGGSAFNAAFGLAVDSNGNAYVVGATASLDVPIVNGFQSTNAGGVHDAFLVKLDPNGQVLYSTYLGGTGDDEAEGVAIDNSGIVYIIGNTDSNDFPTLNAIQNTFAGGKADVFVTKINTLVSGAASLMYSTYLGGPLDELAGAIAVDTNGNTYITGATQCCFPVTPDAFQSSANLAQHPFITKLSPDGSILYSTLLSGSGFGIPRAIAVDSSDVVYVTGETNSTDFPVTSNAFQSANAATAGNATAFIAKLDPGIPGSAGLIFSTYLGGKGPDSGLGIAVDAAGRFYVTGYTSSPTFPTFAAIQPSFGGNEDAFLVEFDLSEPNGSALQFGTFLGGPGQDQALGISLASDRRVALAGFTSFGFPTSGSFQMPNAGFQDGFVASISVDTVAPVVTVPPDATLNATSPAGAVFNFTASASDDSQPNLVASCKLPSGAIFPVGTTTDTCSATDASGNMATASFHVIVEGATAQISDLMLYIGNLNVSSGLSNSLDTKLRAAMQDPLPGACSDLNDFISEVNAHTGKDFSFQAGTFMDTSAARIESVLGCR